MLKTASMTTLTLSKEQFLAYENVRQSGITNMWACDVVARYSGGLLTEDDVVEIISNYDTYAEAYL